MFNHLSQLLSQLKLNGALQALQEQINKPSYGNMVSVRPTPFY